MESFNSEFDAQLGPENRHSSEANKAEPFVVEDLLDFPNEDDEIVCDSVTNNNSTDSSAATAADFSNSPFSGCTNEFSAHNSCRNFSADLCLPYDDMAELEWLSNVAEESFSSEDLQKLELISGMKARTGKASETGEFDPEPDRDAAKFNGDMSVPAKARSKRSRAAPCNWKSGLVVLSQTTSSSKEKKRNDVVENLSGTGEGRKCVHCDTNNTPQWRTGPMGPKTLCNACGVRYKSGRLVPEYRPASSPTFVLTKHSNSHRKVMELRRQKEMAQQQNQHRSFLHHHQNIVFDAMNGEDYLIHQRVGPDYRQLI